MNDILALTTHKHTRMNAAITLEQAADFCFDVNSIEFMRNICNIRHSQKICL